MFTLIQTTIQPFAHKNCISLKSDVLLQTKKYSDFENTSIISIFLAFIITLE